MVSREDYVPLSDDMLVVKSELKLMGVNYPKFLADKDITVTTFTSMIGGHRPPSEVFSGIIYDFLSDRGKI